jgi:signal transduction histidine kinase
MSKYFGIILFSLAVNFSLYCDDRKGLDSLLKLLNSTVIDTTQQKLNRKIGEFYLYNNNKKAIDYFETSNRIAIKLDDKLAMANNLYSIGFCYLQLGNYDNSLKNYLHAISYYEQLDENSRLSKALMSVGNVYGAIKNNKKSNEYYDLAEGLINKLNDKHQASYILSERAIALDKQGDFEQALKYLKRTLDMAKSNNDKDMERATLVNIALTLKHQNNTELALNYCQTALKQYESDPQTPNDIYASVYNNLASIYSQAGNFELAKSAFDKSLNYTFQGNFKEIELENYRNLADLFGKSSDFQTQNLYLKKYYQLKDSLFSNETKNQLTQIESDYQIDKKNIEIVKRDAEVKIQRSQRNLFIILSIAATLLLSGLVYFYNKIRKNNQLLTNLNVQINKQKDELQTLNQVKDRLFSIISHDLRNPLITLRSYLQLSDNESLSADKKLMFKNQTMEAVSQTGNLLDNLLVWANMQIKNTRPNIVPINIDECIGDVLGVLHLSADQKKVKIHEKYYSKNTDEENHIALADFEVLAIALRNIITNAIKFSNENSNIYIDVFKIKNKVNISVKDEGIGLSQVQINEINLNQNASSSGTNGEKGSGLGLFLVKELLKKINAELNIESELGKGSTFTVVLPSLN